jgi:hypothetical protein
MLRLSRMPCASLGFLYGTVIVLSTSNGMTGAILSDLNMPVDLPNLLQVPLERAEMLARLGLGMTGLGKSKWRRMPVFQSSVRDLDKAT